MPIISTSRGRSGRPKQEGWLERLGRKRRARRKIRVPKGASHEAPKGPVYTHVDTRTTHQIKAIVAGIANANEQDAVKVHGKMNDAHAAEAAATDELTTLTGEESRQIQRRDEFAQKVNDAGLGHKLVLQRGFKPLVALAVILAVMFETVSMSSPMALLGVIDFGGSPSTQQRVGAIMAFCLALGYAGVLAVVSKWAGGELKIRHYRRQLEAEDADDEDAEDRPRTTHAIFADRMVWVALGCAALALLGAAVVREAAVAIQAGSGQNQVRVAWWVFMLLTLGIFVGLTAIGYWRSNPIGKAHTEQQDDIDATRKKIEAKRLEAFKHAATIDTCGKELAMIESRNDEEQVEQIQLGLAHIADGKANNHHVYGVLADPDPIHNLVTNPASHIRPVTIPGMIGTLNGRFDAIRTATQASQAGAESQPAIEPEHTEANETGPTTVPEHDDTAALTARLLASQGAKNGDSQTIAS
jgi:hypothetical protein